MYLQLTDYTWIWKLKALVHSFFNFIFHDFNTTIILCDNPVISSIFTDGMISTCIFCVLWVFYGAEWKVYATTELNCLSTISFKQALEVLKLLLVVSSLYTSYTQIHLTFHVQFIDAICEQGQYMHSNLINFTSVGRIRHRTCHSIKFIKNCTYITIRSCRKHTYNTWYVTCTIQIIIIGLTSS